MMLHTFAVYVEDKPGVLNRIASLFRRRAFNIDSLTVGHTETEGVSRMTIVCDADETSARRIGANGPRRNGSRRPASPDRARQVRRRRGIRRHERVLFRLTTASGQWLAARERGQVYARAAGRPAQPAASVGPAALPLAVKSLVF